MSVNVREFQPSFLQGFEPNEIKSDYFTKEYIEYLVEYFHALFKDDILLGIGGLIPETSDVAQASVLLSQNIGHNFIHVHKAVKKMIETCEYRRIYMRCHVDLPASLRWAEMLGFEFEGIERQYVRGADYARYALIKEGV